MWNFEIPRFIRSASESESGPRIETAARCTRAPGYGKLVKRSRRSLHTLSEYAIMMSEAGPGGGTSQRPLVGLGPG
eukprot:633574-Rhodomonas_salina.1